MSNQVSSTSADEMVEMLSLLEEGYGAQLQNSVNGTPRSPVSTASTPTHQSAAMQRLRDLASGVSSKFGYVMGYLKDDRACAQSTSSTDSGF